MVEVIEKQLLNMLIHTWKIDLKDGSVRSVITVILSHMSLIRQIIFWKYRFGAVPKEGAASWSMQLLRSEYKVSCFVCKYVVDVKNPTLSVKKQAIAWRWSLSSGLKNSICFCYLLVITLIGGEGIAFGSFVTRDIEDWSTAHWLVWSVILCPTDRKTKTVCLSVCLYVNRWQVTILLWSSRNFTTW